MELLSQCCMSYKSQQEYKGINWEDVQDKYDKIWDLIIECNFPEETDFERLPNEAKFDEVITKGSYNCKT